MMAHTCKPSTLGGEDWKDSGSRPAWAKNYQDPISNNKLGVVMHAWYPNYTGSLSRRTAVQACPGKKREILPEKYLKQKMGWRHGSGDRSPCLASVRFRGSNPNTPKKKKERGV
jgi:hypothetical protein